MTEQSQQSPVKRSAVERLNEENTQLREQLTLIQQQKQQLQKHIKKQESQIKIYQTKYQALQTQLDKVKTQNHRYIDAYEKEKKQRLLLVNDQQSVLNNLNRDEVELNKLTNENKMLREQVDVLEKSLEQQKSDRVSALREKQNNTNKIKLLQTKLQAATMENKYAKTKQQQMQNENKRLKEQLQEKDKLLAENQAPLQVQTIYKQSNETTQQLFLEFENKMKEKELEMVKEMENYEKKNSALLVRIAELETQLLSVRK